MATSSSGGQPRKWQQGVSGRNPLQPSDTTWSRRMMFTGTLLTLLGAFAFAMWKVYWWSLGSSYGVVLALTDKSDPLGLPGLTYLNHETSGWKALSAKFHKVQNDPGPLIPKDTENLAGFVETLRNQPVEKFDALLAYLGAHGTVRGDTAWLLASSHDPLKPETPRGVAIPQVLEGLRTIRGKTVVLFLDVGDLDYSPQHGVLANRFADAVLQAVAALPADKDCTAWLYLAHSPWQRNHWLTRDTGRRSVFGHYVLAGLSGEADNNGDKVVELGELEAFVNVHVSQYVRSYSGGEEEQTPLLLSLGGPDLSEKARAAKLEGFVMKTVTRTPPPPAGTGTTPAPTASPPAPATSTPAAGTAFGPSRPAPDLAPPRLDPAWNLASGWAYGSTALLLQPAATEPAAPKEPAPPPTPPELPQPSTKKPAWEEVAPPADDDFAGQLQYARRLRDAVAARETAWSPLDDAPHLWREFQEILLQYEQLQLGAADQVAPSLRSGWAADLRTIRKLLADEPTALGPAAGGVQESRQTLGMRLAEARFRLPSEIGIQPQFKLQYWGLGAADKALPQWPQVGRPWLAARLKYDYFLPRDPHFNPLPPTPEKDDALFLRFLATVEGEQVWAAEGSTAEIRWAKLVARAVRDAGPNALDPRNGWWGIVQRSIAARGWAERLAATDGPVPDGWYRALEPLEELRAKAEQELVATAFLAGPTPRDGLRDEWERLLERYRQAATDLDAWRAALRVRNDAWFELPDWMRWFALSRGRTATAPSSSEITDVLTRLTALELEIADAFGRERGPDAGETVRLRTELERSLAVLRTKLRKEVVELLAEQPVVSAPFRIEVLLLTPLPSAADRVKLQDKLRKITPAPPLLAPDQWKKAPAPPRLAKAGTAPDDKLKSHIVERASLQRAWLLGSARRAGIDREALEASVEALGSAAADRFGPALDLCGDRVRTSYDAIRAALEGFAASLESLSGGDVTIRRQRQTAWQAADALCRTIDSHRAHELVNPAVLNGRRLDQWYDGFVRGQRRAVAARDYGPFKEREDCTRAAESQQVCAAFLHDRFAQPVPPPITALAAFALKDVQPPNLSGSNPLDLSRPASEASDEEGVELRWTVANTSEVAAPLCVALEFDPTLLEVRVTDGEGLKLSPSTVPLRGPLPPEALQTFDRGAQRTFAVRLRARQDSRRRPLVTIRLLDRNANQMRAPEIIPVRLRRPPPFELVVAAGDVSGTWDGRGDDLIRLLPYPNTTTNFTLGLKNLVGRGTKVKIELYATPLDGKEQPLWPFHRETGDKLPGIGTLKALAVIPEVALPEDPGQVVRIPFPDEVADDRPDVPGETGVKLKAGKPVPGGMILVVTETAPSVPDERPERLVLPLLAHARLPQTYLTASAQSFSNPAKKRARIVVTVKARDGDSGNLPGGVSRLKVRFAPGVEVPETAAELRAEPGREAVAKLEFDAPLGQESTFWLDVDDFPRAFRFTVPTGPVDGGEIPGAEAVRTALRTPRPGTVLNWADPQARGIPVEVEFDLPSARLRTGDPREVQPPRPFVVTYWQEAGNDLKRPLDTLRSPRDVFVQVVTLGAEGILSLQTRVRDHRRILTLTEGDKSNRDRPDGDLVVAVKAEMFAADGTPENELDRAAVIFDAAPPKFESTVDNLGRHERGRTLKFTTAVSDPQFTVEGKAIKAPVKSVLAGWSAPGKDVFLDEANTFEGAPTDDPLVWKFDIPTDEELKERDHYLLIKATDRVGNVSTKRLRVQIFVPPPPPVAMKPEDRKFTTLVVGLTHYGDGLRNAAILRISPLGRTAQPGPGGAFEFPQVPPGDYTIEIVKASEQNTDFGGKIFQAGIFIAAPPEETTRRNFDLKDAVKPQLPGFPPPPR